MQKVNLVLVATILCFSMGIGDAFAEEHFIQPDGFGKGIGLAQAEKAEPILLSAFLKTQKENSQKPAIKTGTWVKWNFATGAIQPLKSASPKNPNENPLFIGDFNGGWY